MRKRHSGLIALVFGFSGVLAAPQPPSLTEEWKFCQARHPQASTAPFDASYPGGISDKGNALTPATIPGVTTITPRQAECLIDRMGMELVVAGVFSQGEALPYSFAMPFAGTTIMSLTDEQRARVIGQIEMVAGRRLQRPILVYCHHESCMPSHNAAIRLVEAGYRNVFWMREGLKGWKAAGFFVANMMGSESPAVGSPHLQDVPKQAHLYGGDMDYPNPPWEFTQSRIGQVNGKQLRVDRLCIQMASHSDSGRTLSDEEKATPKWLATLHEMAQVDRSTDNDVVERRKMQTFWRDQGHRIYCSPNLLQVSLLKHAYVVKNTAFVRKYLYEWRLPVNYVDHWDGRSPLDFVINEANAGVGNSDHLKREYNELRALGALTRAEAEAAGVIAKPQELQARYIRELEIVATQNQRAALSLAMLHKKGRYTPVNNSEALRWWGTYERLVVEAKDTESMAHIGLSYMPWKNRDSAQDKFSVPDPAAQVGMQWLKRSAEAKNKTGMMLYGRGLSQGWFGLRDEEAAISWLRQSLMAGEILAAMDLANLYARRGDVPMAARYGRSIHPMAYKVIKMADFGLTMEEYFDKHGLSWCGERAPGIESRPMSECGR